MDTRAADRVVRPATLSDLLHDRLLSDIISGRYAPGEKLSLDAISTECGVSRTPVREALQALSQIGFVDVTRNAKTVVADWSVEDMRERVVVLGRLVSFLALSADSVTVREYVRAEYTSDMRRYLDLASEMVKQGVPRLSNYTQRGILGPLRVFAQDHILDAHGVDHATGEATRRRYLTQATEAFADRDNQGASRALAHYADALRVALTLPRVGFGSDTRATHQPEYATSHVAPATHTPAAHTRHLERTP
ncbi:GntR family transcriptional regulator [Microbacterium hydrocarbonoxydans]|uniref:GntR family transcriptional regulator n=1 Tax=Microbacterium hydrocarbonoxydans TaxID=273678 RepID=UPI00203FD4EB|nr:GntR family transcriptional regulator [Microbacterium hydrocarbonoxydans]MCM3781276.1 GntR family transcriptional regulator [Microbacterium hydrocarbonoxydans]